MTASFEEAIEFLSKWEKEHALLFATCSFNKSVVFSSRGCIDLLSKELLLIANAANPAPQSERIFEFAILLEKASNFDYSDVREAPNPAEVRAISLLTFTMPDGRCSIFELAPEV